MLRWILLRGRLVVLEDGVVIMDWSFEVVTNSFLIAC